MNNKDDKKDYEINYEQKWLELKIFFENIYDISNTSSLNMNYQKLKEV